MLHQSKVKIVDPELVWDDLAPRPTRYAIRRDTRGRNEPDHDDARSDAEPPPLPPRAGRAAQPEEPIPPQVPPRRGRGRGRVVPHAPRAPAEVEPGQATGHGDPPVRAVRQHGRRAVPEPPTRTGPEMPLLGRGTRSRPRTRAEIVPEPEVIPPTPARALGAGPGQTRDENRGLHPNIGDPIPEERGDAGEPPSPPGSPNKEAETRVRPAMSRAAPPPSDVAVAKTTPTHHYNLRSRRQ